MLTRACSECGYEDTDRDLKNMWESVQRTQHENLDLKRSNDQLRAEQSQLKDALERLRNWIRYNGHTGQHFASSCKECELNNLAEKALALSTPPPSQEQICCPDCGGGQDRPCDCSSVKTKEITAEMALEWLARTSVEVCKYREKEGYFVEVPVPYGREAIVSEGKTPLEAIRSAMQKEKEGK